MAIPSAKENRSLAWRRQITATVETLREPDLVAFYALPRFAMANIRKYRVGVRIARFPILEPQWASM